MKNIKYLIFITFLLIFLSGCSINYKITIDEDLTINETIDFNYGIVPYTEEYGGDTDEQIETMKEEKLEQAEENNYTVIDNSTDKTVSLTFNRTVAFAVFENPPVLEYAYENFKTSCNETFCSISARAIKNEITGDGETTDYKTSITVPFNVIKTNADEIDLQTNTYIWYHIIEGKQNDIELIFERNGKNVIKENNLKNSANSWIWFIIVIVLFLIISIIGIKIIRNNKPEV
jgi:hypothetical protein